MARTSARQRRYEKTRQSILDAARQIIVGQGPDALSMRTLAARIDYSPSGLYEYFDSKEQIIQEVCGEGHWRLTQAMSRVDVSLSPEEYLLRIGEVYIEFAVENPELFRLMFASVPAEMPDEGLLSSRSSFRVLLQAIQRGIDSGVFKPRPGFGLYEMAFASWSMVHGISMLRIFMPEGTPSFAAFKHQALLTLQRGLTNASENREPEG